MRTPSVFFIKVDAAPILTRRHTPLTRLALTQSIVTGVSSPWEAKARLIRRTAFTSPNPVWANCSKSSITLLLAALASVPVPIPSARAIYVFPDRSLIYV